MKERLALISSVITIFILGCLFGGYALWINLRMNALDNSFNSLKQGVEQFAKQVNEEFKKRDQKHPKVK